MIVGYLMNMYPMVSTTFIGREIAALEAQGLTVRRYAIRRWTGPLADPGDLREAAATCYLLAGLRRRPLVLLRALAGNPAGVFRAARLTLALVRAAGGGLVRHAAYLAEAIVLHQAARRDGVEHLHAHFSTNSATVAMLVGAMGGPPFSFTVHGPDEFFRPFEISLGEKIARARFVVAISHFCRSQLMHFSDPAHWGKIAIVHCGVDPAAYGRAPRGDFGKRGAFGKRAIFVGRLDPVKGAPLLIEAFARVRADHPEARLTVVGDGPARAPAEAQAAALGLGGAVAFAGFRTQAEVAALLEEADMLVLPSFAEGLPVVLMEALAARIPVVASRVAGVQELVEDGVSGFAVPPGDVATLAARMSRLMDDPEAARAMGAAGRAKVEAEFDIAREGAWLAAILRAGGPPGGRLRPDQA
jgi:glycosyltransferase involved in cell wall biosynthesis